MEQSALVATTTAKGGKGKTIAVIVGGLVVLGGGIAAYFLFFNKDANGQTFFKRKKAEADAKKLNDELAKEDKAKETGQPYTSPPAPSGFPIASGNRGAEVKRLQSALNKNFGKSLKADGAFGTKTLAALREIGYDVPVNEPTLKLIEAGTRKGGNVQSGKSAIAIVSGIPIYDIYNRDRVIMTTAKGSVYHVTGLQGDSVLLADSEGGLKKWFAEKKYFATA
jgi:hypothetical protein